jgi:hypothetical protein
MRMTPCLAAALAVLGAMAAACTGSGGIGEAFQPAAIDPLFSEDFESGSLAEWHDGVDAIRHRIVTDARGAQSGTRYLSVTYPAGGDGGWLTRFLQPGHESLYVSFYVRVPHGWTGGTKLIALYGSRADDRWSAFGKAGTCPDGADFFAAMLATEPGADPGPLRFYTYYPGMRREPDGVTCWGRYGNDGSGAVYAASSGIAPGAWHRVEFWVQLNAAGRSDGQQAFWIDGSTRGTWMDLRLRDVRDLELNAVQLSFNSGESGVLRTQQLHVDNLIVRTGRP